MSGCASIAYALANQEEVGRISLLRVLFSVGWFKELCLCLVPESTTLMLFCLFLTLSLIEICYTFKCIDGLLCAKVTSFLIHFVA
jgi:hypothetical protein